MKRFAIMVVVAFLCSCSTVGHQVDQSAVEKIQKGVTAKQDVLSLIGSPDQITNMESGDCMWSYIYSRSSVKPATFIPYVGLFVGGANTQNQSVMITFGPDNIVKGIRSSYGANDVNTNLSSGSKANIPAVEDNKRPQ